MGEMRPVPHAFHQPDHFLLAEAPALPSYSVFRFLAKGIEISNEASRLFA